MYVSIVNWWEIGDVARSPISSKWCAGRSQCGVVLRRLALLLLCFGRLPKLGEFVSPYYTYIRRLDEVDCCAYDVFLRARMFFPWS